MRYKNLVLDVGEVLLSYRWLPMMEEYGLSPEESRQFYDMMFGDGRWDEFDLGILPYEAIMEKYVERYPVHEDAIRYFLTHYDQMPVPRPKVYEQVERLMDRGMKAYILSNYPDVLFASHTKLIPFMDRLSGKVVSSSIHVMKPDRRIYETLFAEYGILPGESIFFDDRMVNVEASIAAGMDAVCVGSEEALIRELAKLDAPEL